METNERKELYARQSRNKLTNEVTTFRLLAGPGSRKYTGPLAEEIKRKDRIIYIEVSNNGAKVEIPYSVDDQEAIWEQVFDVWVLPEKKLRYAQRFLKLIKTKLLQAKLDGFGLAYWEDI